jgi:MFS transporter, AAHS family, 4-hydroxybenzoate transporter
MPGERIIEVDAHVDAAPVGAFQLRVLGLCALIGLVEGFDSQTAAYVAPLLMGVWKISAQAYSIVFSASLIGAVAGAIAFGFIGDRYGRRRSVLIALLIVGASTLAAAQSASMAELIIYRFLTGVGLGGTVPNATTLTSEYAPKRVRATFVTLMWAGYPLGAAVGGVLSAWLLQAHDWRSIFLAGGATTLIVLPCALLWLPESIQYLAKIPRRSGELRTILQRVNPRYQPGSADVFVVQDAATSASSLKALFADGRTARTLSLWALFGLNVLLLFFLISWLPTILNAAGLDLSRAIGATSAFGVGGILGSVLLGRLVDTFGARSVMLPAYLLCAVALVSMGRYAAEQGSTVMILAFCVGFFVAGLYHVLQAVAAQFYPPSIRATGLGWAVGVGRCGSIIGILLGGLMMSRGWGLSQIFVALIVPALICAAAATVFCRSQPVPRAQAAVEV